MLTKLAIKNYRSIFDLVIPLSDLNLVIGANGSGKSNLYKALRLLSNIATGGVIKSIAQEGGIQSSFWAGPELSSKMMVGEANFEGSHKKNTSLLHLGLSTEEFGYMIKLGVAYYQRPEEEYRYHDITAFNLDPVIRQELIWSQDLYKHNRKRLQRDNRSITIRAGNKSEVIEQNFLPYESLFNYSAIPSEQYEFLALKGLMQGWRFYDHFRTDIDAPARQTQLGTYTPILHHDGRDLAAALQTIIEMGDKEALDLTLSDAFSDSKLEIDHTEDGLFTINFYQDGLLRPLTGNELSDGTLRFLLLSAALLSPRLPSFMVLNEPETSLHPSLIPALARLICKTSKKTQVLVVSHSDVMVDMLSKFSKVNVIELEKKFSETTIKGQDNLNAPAWNWE